MKLTCVFTRRLKNTGDFLFIFQTKFYNLFLIIDDLDFKSYIIKNHPSRVNVQETFTVDFTFKSELDYRIIAPDPTIFIPKEDFDFYEKADLAYYEIKCMSAEERTTSNPKYVEANELLEKFKEKYNDCPTEFSKSQFLTEVPNPEYPKFEKAREIFYSLI